MMIDILKNILSEINEINAYRIVERKTESRELFFVKKNLDMNRAKNVHYFEVTVYRDFEEDEVKYRGSSTTNIHPTMGIEEIKKAILEASFAAGFVKNEHYPLAIPSEEPVTKLKESFSAYSMDEWLPKIVDAVHRVDKYDRGSINSMELFLNRTYKRIINSEGVDLSYENYSGNIEFITNWKEDSEEVELYKNINFADFDEAAISKAVEEMFTQCSERARAALTPSLEKCAVLLTGEPASDFFSYYQFQSGAQQVYEQTSTAKVNEGIQGGDIKGDKINLVLDPFMENSTWSRPCDDDGYVLNRVKILEDGILKNFWGDVRHCYYLGACPTGSIKNIVVEGGSRTLEDLKSEPYLELVAFSAFNMEPVTGDFGGEIRLGYYFDGKTTVPVTGGSISGNIKDVQGEMYFSKELQKENNFIGPRTVKLFNVSIAGNK